MLFKFQGIIFKIEPKLEKGIFPYAVSDPLFSNYYDYLIGKIFTRNIFYAFGC